MEWADDAHGLGAEVHGHGRLLHPDDATEPIAVVRDAVLDRVLLDSLLGLRLEGAAGEVAPLTARKAGR